jgi:iron complex transport system permease protein
MTREKSIMIHVAWLAPALLVCIVAAAAIGSADIRFVDSLRIIVSKIPVMNQVISTDGILPVYTKIIWQVRMPRILLAALVGSGLSVVGASFQGLFRNSLADPHILGISSGAAVGATIAMISGLSFQLLGLSFICAAAFTGAVVTAFLVYKISSIGNKLPAINILLTGIAVSAMLSAMISLLMTLNKEQIDRVYMWTLGSFSSATNTKVAFLFAFSIATTIGLLLYSRKLNVIATGEETAESLGIDTSKVKKTIIILASLLVAACVSVSGIIGFVGLIIPHCTRLISGPKHERLLPLSCFGGAIFMIICDAIARTAVAPSEIPVGVITSVFGAPFFIFLLQRSKRRLVR